MNLTKQDTPTYPRQALATLSGVALDFWCARALGWQAWVVTDAQGVDYVEVRDDSPAKTPRRVAFERSGELYPILEQRRWELGALTNGRWYATTNRVQVAIGDTAQQALARLVVLQAVRPGSFTPAEVEVPPHSSRGTPAVALTIRGPLRALIACGIAVRAKTAIQRAALQEKPLV